MSTPDRARGVLAEAVSYAPEEIPADAAIGSFEPWDSLAHARLMIALETTLNRALTADEITSVLSLRDIELLLDAS